MPLDTSVPSRLWSAASGIARRCRRTLAALDRALAEGPDGREEIVAEELRLAARPWAG